MENQRQAFLDAFFNDGHKIIFPKEIASQFSQELMSKLEDSTTQKGLLAQEIKGKLHLLRLKMLRYVFLCEQHPDIRDYYLCLEKITRYKDKDLPMLQYKETKVIQTINEFRCDLENRLDPQEATTLRRLIVIWVLFSDYIFDYENTARLNKVLWLQ